ncbi:hypothetical protein NDU88_002251 [Pleurodeles waltl]|uniref:Uncharacterized protein n=1 Tax=Pleurodeles waltl TaxID=8319 RepID=A0AAV7T1J9_PLEWA|nr:hypothetical protein NDU88_002251 [Pleurodeles waltl]
MARRVSIKWPRTGNNQGTNPSRNRGGLQDQGEIRAKSRWEPAKRRRVSRSSGKKWGPVGGWRGGPETCSAGQTGDPTPRVRLGPALRVKGAASWEAGTSVVVRERVVGENSGRAAICPAPGVGGTGRTKVAARAMSPKRRRPESGSARRSAPNSSRRAGGSSRKTLSGLESEMVDGQLLPGCSGRIGSGAMETQAWVGLKGRFQQLSPACWRLFFVIGSSQART